MSQHPHPELIDACEAFARGKAEPALARIADDVTWRVVGDRTLSGKPAVAAFCAEMAAQGMPELRITRRIRCDTVVVIEGQVRSDEGIHFCDLFDLADGRIVGIASYVICKGPGCGSAADAPDSNPPAVEPSA
jgi:hypothetical protein